MASQHAANENTNGLIRQFVQKSRDRTVATGSEFSGIEQQLNRLLRRCLNPLTGYDVLNNSRRQLTAVRRGWAESTSKGCQNEPPGTAPEATVRDSRQSCRRQSCRRQSWRTAAAQGRGQDGADMRWCVFLLRGRRGSAKPRPARRARRHVIPQSAVETGGPAPDRQSSRRASRRRGQSARLGVPKTRRRGSDQTGRSGVPHMENADRAGSRRPTPRRKRHRGTLTQALGAMPVVWVVANGPDSRCIEQNAIGLLSNYQRPAVDPPSAAWLGRSCDREEIRKSGLWNVKHVTSGYDPAMLEKLDTVAGG